ncbi:MAG: purine-nucleoside phosphorylase [Hyphomicrobiales bacterium]
MSVHNEAKRGEIAETVLLPGDPLRAKYIAENFLEEVKCYNKVRNMYGFTGFYKGKRVSVQGTGMGVPSISIYVNELINEYGAKNLIRIGTCGTLQRDMALREVILAMSSCTDSSMNKVIFDGMDYAPTANFNLLNKSYEYCTNKNIPVSVGPILTSDVFYTDQPPAEYYKKWADYGVLAVEMESTALYTIAAKKKVNALSILTVTDNLQTMEFLPAEERQQSLNQMIEIALNVAE